MAIAPRVHAALHLKAPAQLPADFCLNFWQWEKALTFVARLAILIAMGATIYEVVGPAKKAEYKRLELEIQKILGPNCEFNQEGIKFQFPDPQVIKYVTAEK